MSKFEKDLDQEGILSQYLDKIYKKIGINFKRESNINEQHKGVDLIITQGAKDSIVDEKAQLHYLNKDLPTFAFELNYLKGNTLNKGWLFDSNKKTEYYFLITGIYLKEGIYELTTHHDIDSVKITKVDRAKLIEYLKSIGLDKKRLDGYADDIRRDKLYGKNEIKELDKITQGNVYFTMGLDEKPINLVLKLKYLVEKGIAQKLNYV